ncbi:MAG: HAD family hydrolase [Oscillospiraceae bacterium]
MEIINPKARRTSPITTAVFDFDGTVSTLRANWEEIMYTLMLEQICPLEEGESYPEALRQEIEAYIDESTGIQTAYQMQWLQERVLSYGKNKNAAGRDLWWYKDEYNRLLLEMVHTRIDKLGKGELNPADFRIAGSLEFCKALHEQGVTIYIASGTDDVDLQKEVGILGLSPYVAEVKGAPEREISCSKEKVLERLLATIPAAELAVFGDGKVEIMLGHKAGAVTVGTATDETALAGINPVKYSRLAKAGADVITGDFLDKDELFSFIGL